MTTSTMNTGTISGLSHLVEAATALTKLVDGPQDTSSNLPTAEAREDPRSVSDDEDAKRKTRIHASSREIFPQRLFQILSDSSLSDVISWLPHGRSFVIIRPDVFSERVLPLYFPSNDSRTSTKYPSFTRKLNRWGFRQATRGPDTGAFHHPLFRRDQPQVCLDMVCQKSRKRPSATSTTCKTKTTKALTVAKATPAMPPPAGHESKQQATQLTSETLAALPTSEPQHLNKTVSTVSADDRSVSSGGTTATPTQQFQTPQLPTLSPWVPRDPSLVAATLRAREHREKLAVAKSMLYEAYLNALKGANMQQPNLQK